MKTSKPAPPILNERGIIISREHLTVPGRTFKWGSLGLVKVVRLANFLTLFTGKYSRYCLMVSTKTDPTTVCVFETKERELMERVEEAINRVGRMLGAQKT